MLFTFTSLCAAAPLRNFVCVVRGNLSKDTVTFLEKYRDTLSSRGYSAYSDDIDAYLKGSFGSGFVYYADNGKPYVITNRHVVAESETVNIEFENEDGSVSDYKELKILAVDEDVDIALVALPESFSRKGLDFSLKPVSDGDEVWSAGFPGLGNDPMWQLGKGIVSNSRARIKELISPDISTVIQHSAQVDPGNSGGPLMITDSGTASGYRVVGVNTWKAAYRESTNFSIPAAAVLNFIKKNTSSEKKAGSFDDRIKQFVKSLGNTDMRFLAVARYISNEMTGKCGGDMFLSAVSKASTDDRDVIIHIFEYDPVEGLRYALAYSIWNQFQGNSGALSTEAGTPETSTNGMKISFTPEGKDAVSSLWSEEQGNWRLVEFGTISASKLGKKDGTSKSSSVSFELEDPYFITVDGGMLLPYGQDPGFHLYAGFTNNFIAGGLFFQSENCSITSAKDSDSATSVTKMNTAGISARIQIPFTFGKVSVIPFGEARIGIANVAKLLTDGSSSLVFGLGGGLDVSCNINDMIAPFISAEYLRSSYFSVAGNNSDIVISAGLKLFERMM